MNDKKSKGSKVIVSYQNLDDALSKPESAAETEKAADAMASTPEERAAMLVAINNALRKLEAASQGRKADVLVSPEHRAASLLQTYVANRAIDANKLEEAGPNGEYLEAKFDDKDWISWAGSFFSWWKGIVDHDWLATPSIDEFDNSARLALFGDWGTGMYGAPECGQSVEKDQRGYAIRLHLGDVYYSGDEDEVKERFLAFWPKNITGQEISRACNSNHEMYTGGHAYFDQTLNQFQQAASYFALRNDHWILAGLDTAYKEKDLAGDQVAWLTDLVAQADGRRVILFSHHQPYSIFEGGQAKIVDKLSALLEGQKIFAWYWGHEHRCTLFNVHARWNLFGRCVGHSGYPYFRDKLDAFESEASDEPGIVWRFLPPHDIPGNSQYHPGARVLDGHNRYLGDEEQEYGTQGYMSLEFDEGHLNEIVHAPDGVELYNRQLV